MLRDWTNSDKINSITVYAERFFIRLIMKVDDYGCFYGDPRILRANLFPLLQNGVREADISRWMAECQKAGLIRLYESDEGKHYLQICDFRQRLDRAKAKFPKPEKFVNDFPREVEVEVEEKGTARAHDRSNLNRQPNIPTKEQVLETILRAGGTPEMAESFYQKHEGAGWFINNSPIVNYAALAARFVTNWKDNDKKRLPKEGPVTVYKKL
jgi:hypothetical protein